MNATSVIFLRPDKDKQKLFHVRPHPHSVPRFPRQKSSRGDGQSTIMETTGGVGWNANDDVDKAITNIN